MQRERIHGTHEKDSHRSIIIAWSAIQALPAHMLVDVHQHVSWENLADQAALTLICPMSLPARQTSSPSTTVTSCPMFFTSSLMFVKCLSNVWPEMEQHRDRVSLDSPRPQTRVSGSPSKAGHYGFVNQDVHKMFGWTSRTVSFHGMNKAFVGKRIVLQNMFTWLFYHQPAATSVIVL